jgi:hypothetical protein
MVSEGLEGFSSSKRIGLDIRATVRKGVGRQGRANIAQ